MNRVSELSQLIVASWLLADDENPIPTSHGILDRALADALRRAPLPPWASESLHFVDARVGLQCVELPAILDRAQKAQLTTAPNPSYQETKPRISRAAARHFLRKLGIAENDALQFGQALKSAASAAILAKEKFDASAEVLLEG